MLHFPDIKSQLWNVCTLLLIALLWNQTWCYLQWELHIAVKSMWIFVPYTECFWWKSLGLLVLSTHIFSHNSPDSCFVFCSVFSRAEKILPGALWINLLWGAKEKDWGMWVWVPTSNGNLFLCCRVEKFYPWGWAWLGLFCFNGFQNVCPFVFHYNSFWHSFFFFFFFGGEWEFLILFCKNIFSQAHEISLFL